MKEIRKYLNAEDYSAITPEQWSHKAPEKYEDFLEGKSELRSTKERMDWLHTFVKKEIERYIRKLENVDGPRIVNLMDERDFILTCIKDRVKSEYTDVHLREYDEKLISFNDLLILLVR